MEMISEMASKMENIVHSKRHFKKLKIMEVTP